MSYQLPSDVDARVQAQLANGEYPSADDVLRDAMDSLERRQQSLDKLRSMVQEADEDIAAGRIGYFDVAATMRTVEQRVAAKSPER